MDFIENTKDIHIGSIIKRKLIEKSMTITEFASKINRERTTARDILKRKNVDTEFLIEISKVLEYDFIHNVYYVGQTTQTICILIKTEEDALKKDSEMGRKTVVPYGLYRQEGYISANLARTMTGFSDTDLNVFWDALIHMFDDDRSAGRGKMALRALIVFKHDSPLGNAPAHKLFDRVIVSRREGVSVPRKYTDYVVTVDTGDFPDGVTAELKYQDDV
jgi:CRISPR-associated protein Csd2